VPLLKLINGDRDGGFVDVAAGGVLGREPGCVLCLDHPTVSRKHAELQCQDGAVELRDLSSANGTYVNGRRIDGRPHLLAHGDQLFIGALQFEFREFRPDGDIPTLDRPMVGRGSRSATVASGNLLDHQFALARLAQRRLVLHAPCLVPGYSVEHHFAPAKGVGGDFALQSTTSEGHCLAVIGSVCGSGLPSAIFMAYVCGVINALASSIESPSDLLQRLNRSLNGVLEPGMYVTAQALTLDPAHHTVRIATAGQQPPMFLRSTEAARQLTMPGGLVLGLTEDARVGSTELTLERGDMLLLHTDGLQKAANTAAEQLGYRPCLNAASRSASALDAVRRLTRLLARHTGETAAVEDLTLLAVERVG
jgi:hypothetical protein